MYVGILEYVCKLYSVVVIVSDKIVSIEKKWERRRGEKARAKEAKRRDDHGRTQEGRDGTGAVRIRIGARRP